MRVPFHYRGLWCPVYRSGWFCQFALSVPLMWLPYLHQFPPISVHTRSYQCSLSHFTPVSSHMLKCSSAHNLSHLAVYCSSASIGHVDMLVFCCLVRLFTQSALTVSVCNILVSRYSVCNAWSCAINISTFSFSLQISPWQPQ
jgi:hypothetical protein